MLSTGAGAPFLAISDFLGQDEVFAVEDDGQAENTFTASTTKTQGLTSCAVGIRAIMGV